MMYIRKIFLFFLLTFSITAIANDFDTPKPLNKNDEDLYKEIFALQITFIKPQIAINIKIDSPRIAEGT